MMKADAMMLRGLAIVSEASASSGERNEADALLVARIRAGDEQADQDEPGFDPRHSAKKAAKENPEGKRR